MSTESDNDLITVCSDCLRASCWQGEFFCDSALDPDSSITQKTRGELRELDLEDSRYWKTDYELVEEGDF